MKNPEEIIFRGATHVVVEQDLKRKLDSGKRLRIKLGIDPSGSRLTIGHAVNLWRLKAFQELGHQIVLVIGTFTGQIGDASDKDSERPMLTAEEVLGNMEHYSDFVSEILDMKNVEVVKNGDWFDKMPLGKFFELQRLFSVAQMIERDNFAKRLAKGNRIGLHEFSYSLLQGYDSVQVRADVEIGGNDQLFNNLAGRTIQKAYGQEPQEVIVYDLLLGSDGKKMSKTSGNCIWIDDEANDMYGKVMRIDDEQIIQYYELATIAPNQVIDDARARLQKGDNPRDVKAALAKEIVTLYHGEKAADEAERAFNDQFREGKMPSDIKTVKLEKTEWQVDELLVKTDLAPSKSEAKRLLQQGAVKLNQQKINSEQIVIKNGDVIQAGKRRFAKLAI